MTLLHLPDSLVSTDWLSEHLRHPRLRVVECSVHLTPRGDGDLTATSARPEYEAGHIPTAVYADLINDLSAPGSLRFMLPEAARFAEGMSRLGVSDDDTVVLYDRTSGNWGPRLWWMLRAFGFDRAAVLDGGWSRWLAEGQPVETDIPSPAEAWFTPKPRPGLFVGKEEVRRAVEDPSCQIVNALTTRQHRGEGGPDYGRPGHIANSVSLPVNSMFDIDTKRFIPQSQQAEATSSVNLTPERRTIVYCGGGIAASTDAFVLHRLGHENVAVYDASLQEWARDPDMPMERG